MSRETGTPRAATAQTQWPKTLAILAGLSVLQVAVFDQFWIGGRIRIDLLLLAVVSIGLRAEVRQATLLGFVVGLFVDVFRFGPFGLHALIFCLAGWVLANNGVRMLQVGAAFRMIQGAIAVLLVTTATWTAAAVFGQRPPAFGNDSLISIVLTALVGGALLAPIDMITRRMVEGAPTSSRVPRTDLVRADP